MSAVTHERTDPGLAAEQRQRQGILDLVRGATIETTPGIARKISDYRAYLPPGTSVAVTFLAGTDFRETLETAIRLRTEGFNPIPHFAARSIPSEQALNAFVRSVTGEAGATEVVCIAGGVTRAIGPFDDSMAILESGVFEAHGIERIGVAGHPEGSKDIRDADLWSAIERKNLLARGSSADYYLLTQFVLDSSPVIAWERALRERGNELPVRIGLPGVAHPRTLVKYAFACGVRPSMRVLVRQTTKLLRAMTVTAPDRLIGDIERARHRDPANLIEGIHIYPFGGLGRTTQWLRAAMQGDFEFKSNGGFAVQAVHGRA